MSTVNIAYTRQELEPLLAKPVPPEALIPELAAAARDPSLFLDHPGLPALLHNGADIIADVHNQPQLTYTKYRDVHRTNIRAIYEKPWHERRAKLAAAALQVLLGHDEYLNTMYDYMWAMCEESNWIVPQREDLTIDLRSAATIMDLSEICVAMAHKVEDRIINRVGAEIERRVFGDYMANHDSIVWYRGHNNWNGVCNSAVGAMFLLLEPDQERQARALELVLSGLQAFFDTAFEPDGSCAEGVHYWQYGLGNTVAFAEMLRLRTDGAIDILADERVIKLARYPMAVMLAPGRYFSYSDSHEENAFDAGIMARLAERTGVSELLGVLAGTAEVERRFGLFHNTWRSLLWWDGARPPLPEPRDAYLPESGVAKLVSTTRSGAQVVLAAKASHNGVSHNHNDVGVFVLNVDGETFICDPESGVYDNYKKQGDDQVIFSNSFGHSVPVIGGKLQSKGKKHGGQVTAYEPDGAEKRVTMEIQGAYQVEGLRAARRTWRLLSQGDAAGEVILEDSFDFAGEALPAQEAFVTWRNSLVSGRTALILGEKHVLQLTIEEPSGASFALQVLDEESNANEKATSLRRLSIDLPAQSSGVLVRVRARVLP